MKKLGLLIVSTVMSVSMVMNYDIELRAGEAKKAVYVEGKTDAKVITLEQRSRQYERTHYVDDMDIPYEVQELAEKYGKKYGICPEFMEAIIEHESSFELNAEAVTDLEHSVGPAQINLKCSDHYDRMEKLGIDVEDLNTYEGSIEFMADYLKTLFDTYEDAGEVLMRYNGDKTNLKIFWKTGELSDYAKEILERSAELERKHGK